jgi:hypothetical protein
MAYNTTKQSDLHSYFDISYEEQGNLVQADSTATYYFSKICKITVFVMMFDDSSEKCEQVLVCEDPALNWYT